MFYNYIKLPCSLIIIKEEKHNIPPNSNMVLMYDLLQINTYLKIYINTILRKTLFKQICLCFQINFSRFSDWQALSSIKYFYQAKEEKKWVEISMSCSQIGCEHIFLKLNMYRYYLGNYICIQKPKTVSYW